MEGGAVSCEELDVAYDSSGEAHILANKVSPTLTASLVKRASVVLSQLQAKQQRMSKEMVTT